MDKVQKAVAIVRLRKEISSERRGVSISIPPALIESIKAHVLEQRSVYEEQELANRMAKL